MLGAVRAEEHCPTPPLKPQLGYSPRSAGGAGSQKSLRAVQRGPHTPSLHAPRPGFSLVVRAVPGPSAVTPRSSSPAPAPPRSHARDPRPPGGGAATQKYPGSSISATRLPPPRFGQTACPSQALSSCYAASYSPTGKVRGGGWREVDGWKRRYRVERGRGGRVGRGERKKIVCVEEMECVTASVFSSQRQFLFSWSASDGSSHDSHLCG